MLVGGVNNGLPDGGSLDRHGICPESSRVSELDSVRSGVFGGFVHIIGAGRVESRIGLRDEPDAERTPDSQDKRVAPGRKLPPSKRPTPIQC